MPDRVSMTLKIGSWFDESENRPLMPLGDVELFPGVGSMDEFVSDSVRSLVDAKANPWKHDFSESACYANAGGSSWQLAMSLAPFLEAVLDPETARMVAGAFLGALFGRIIKRPTGVEGMSKKPNIARASEMIVEYMTQRDNLAPSQIKEISIARLDDGSFESIVQRETDGHRFLFRIAEDGMITGRIDLDELIIYSKRVAGPPPDEARN